MPQRSIPIRQASLAILVAAASLQACAKAPPSDSPLREARVIVRFKPGVDPSDAAFRARLAASTGAQGIDVVRPMSGDSWVLRITCDDAATSGASTADGCDGAMRRMAASPWVASVERDRRERHQ